MPQPWSVGEALTAGVNAVKKNPLELIGGFFIVTLLSILPGQIPTVLMLTGVIKEGTALYWGLVTVCSLLGAVVGAFLWVGEVRVALAAVRGEPFDFALFFSGGDRAIAMLAANFVMSLAIILGLVLLIIPGIVLAYGLMLTTFLVVDAEEGPIEAMKTSWEATQGQKMQLFLFSLALLLVVVAGACACYIGIFVALPILFVAMADVYRRITGRMGGEAY